MTYLQILIVGGVAFISIYGDWLGGMIANNIILHPVEVFFGTIVGEYIANLVKGTPSSFNLIMKISGYTAVTVLVGAFMLRAMNFASTASIAALGGISAIYWCMNTTSGTAAATHT